MSRKEISMRKFMDDCVEIHSHSQGRTLTARSGDGSWFVWGALPVTRAPNATDDDIEVDVYSLAEPTALEIHDRPSVKSVGINGVGVLYLTEHGSLCQSLIDFKELSEQEVVVVATEPVSISLPVHLTIEQFCCGEDFTLLLTHTGQLFSFGNGTYGQLGHGDLHEREEPILLEAFAQLRISGIAAGSHHCLAYCDTDDCVYSWGAGTRGQLGTGQTADRHSPYKIKIEDAETGYVVLNCGEETSGLVSEDGKAYVWGSNSHFQLGRADAADVLLPIQVDLHAVDIVQLLLGEGIGLVRTRDHRVYGWGRKLPFLQSTGLPRLILAQQESKDRAITSAVANMALLNRQIYYQTEENTLLKYMAVNSPTNALPDPRLIKLVVILYGHVRAKNALAASRALQKWRQCTGGMSASTADALLSLKACAARIVVTLLKNFLFDRMRKYWYRWRNDAQESRVTARMDAIASEYQTSLRRMRRTKSDLQDVVQQYHVDVRSKEAQLSKSIGAKRVAAISRVQIVRRERTAFERWKLVCQYSTQATQLQNDKYKLEIGLYQLTTQQKESQEIEDKARRIQAMLAAVTAFYRWKLGTERWKIQVMQEEFQAERATVAREMHGLLSQINKINSFEREAVTAARTRGAAVIHELFNARKILQDATETTPKPPKNIGTPVR